jgi:hypothetical protein
MKTMFTTRRKFVSVLVALTAGLASAATVQAQQAGTDTVAAPYTLESLEGNYALVGTFGDHLAQSQGVFNIDGRGHLTAVQLVNAPSSTGQRTLISITVSGTYTVNPNGTGVLVLTLTLPNSGGTATVTQDLLITKAQEIDREKLATEWVSMQREVALGVGGANGTLVTFVATRRP